MADKPSFYTRVDSATTSGAPLGASIDIARTTRTNAEAAQVGALFGRGQSFVQPGNRINAQGQVVPEDPDGTSFWDRVGGVVSSAGRPILRALEFGTEALGNVAEADMRAASQAGRNAMQRGDIAGLARTAGRSLLPILRLTDDEWKSHWDDAVKAQASVGQTAWLLSEQSLADLGLVDPGTSGSGVYDPMTDTYGPRVSSGGLDLLDNPDRWGQRQEYFSEGAARWTTGIGDALWQVFADPLLVGGKAASSIRASRALLSADDVARIADRTVETAELTGRQTRARNLVRELAESFEKADSTEGAVTALSRSRFLRNSTDGGAIAHYLTRAGEGIDDAAERIAAREDVIYAGMGDQAALARLGRRSELLEVELRKMQTAADEFDVSDVLGRADLDDADAVDSAFRKANDQPLLRREMDAQRASIRQQLDELERIRAVGEPVQGISGVGQLATVPGRRDIAKVARTIQNGPGLEPIHLVTGRHLPGTFRLSDDDAPNVFHTAIIRGRGILRGSPQFEEFAKRFAALEDEFVAAGVGSSSKATRLRVMDRFDRLVDEAVAAKYGLGDDMDGLAAVHNKMRSRRQHELRNIATRVYQAREAGVTPMVNTGDGVYAFGEKSVPVLRSQLEDYVSIVDPRRLDQFANAHFKNGLGGFVTKVETSRGWEVTEATLGIGNRLWKFGALLRPWAYFVRAQVDTQARLMAKIGPLKYAAQAMQGSRNTLANLRKVDKAEARAFTARFYMHQRIDDLEHELHRLGDETLDEAKAMREELAELKTKVSEPLDWKPSGEKVRVRNTGMARNVGQTGRMSRDGTQFTRKGSRVTDAYLSHDAVTRAISQMDAEDSITGLLTGSTRGQLDQMHRSGKWDLIAGNDEAWEKSYLRAVNYQVRQDAMGQRLLAGASDEELAAWLRETAEGRAYLKDMRSAGSGPVAALIERMREHVDTLLPADSPVRAAALSRTVDLDDIKAAWDVPSARPHVPGEMLSSNPKQVIMREYEAIERKYFHWVAQMPENMMGRHPFYAARFEQHAKNVLARAGNPDEATLSLAQINDIRRQAAQMARRDVARYMFDTSKQTNIGHSLRFLSPFYSAWEDTMTKWARIFGENPAAAVVFWDVARSPNAAGWVVDRDGNQIDVYGDVRDRDGNVIGKAGIMDGYVLIPGAAWDPTGKLREWTGTEDLRIAKNAANVIFQGDPWFLPGPGPVLAVPTNELVVRAFPEWWPKDGETASTGQHILQYILPYGPTSDSIGEQVLPSWAKAAKDALSQDGRRFDAVFTTLYQEQVNAERNGETRELTDDERISLVAQRARNWTVLRLFGTQMPFTFQPQSRLAWYKSEYDRYRRELGPGAEDQFAADYPEFLDMAISLSANETGLTADDDSWVAVQRYRNDIAKHPEYGWFWAGAENLAGGFNQGVYHAQMRQPIGPGTSQTFRSRKDPLEVARETNVSEGWRLYQQFNTALRLKLEERGLHSFSQTGAEDLQQIRSEAIQGLSEQYPDWAADFNKGGGPSGRVGEFLTLAVEQYNAHPELLERGDGQAMAMYLQVRDALKAKMAERGTSSINAQSNADLKAIWDEFTAGLIQRDLGFEQAFTRVLEQDDLTADLYVGGE